MDQTRFLARKNVITPTTFHRSTNATFLNNLMLAKMILSCF
jgi:hypothetical protein